MFFKLLMFFLSTFYSNSKLLSVTLNNIALIIYVILIIRFTPYKDQEINNLELIS